MKDKGIFKHQIRAVILDLDGTLIHSTSLWADIDKAFFGLRNMEVPEEYAQEIAHIGLEKAAQLTQDKYFPNEDAKAIMKEWVDAAKHAYDETIQLKDGVIEFLQFLQKYNICPVVCTANSPDVYDKCMVRLGLYRYINSDFYNAKNYKNGKSTSEIFDDIAKKLGCRKDEIIVFEDLLEPLKVAHDAGYFTVGVNDKYSVTEPEVNKKNCDLFINDFFEFIEFFKENYFFKDEKGFTYIPYTKSYYEIIDYDHKDEDVLVLPKTFNGKKVISIGYNAFKNNSFKKIVFNDNIRHLDFCSFDDSKELESVELPRRVNYMSFYVFGGDCHKVKKLTFNNGFSNYSQAFSGFSGVEEIVFHPDQKRIPFRGLWFFDGLKEVKIIEGIEEIAGQGFNHCSNLETIYLPHSIKWIMDNAFYRCPSIKKVIYNGSKEDREKIHLFEEGNETLINAEWVYLK